MKFKNTLYNFFLVLLLVVFASCKDLTDLNVNPNAVDPTTVNPNFEVPTVITATALPYLDFNYEGNMAGVMSYIQKSGWGSGLNNFSEDWIGGRTWGGYYGNLRNIYHLYDRSKAEKMEFHQGVALVLKAFNFGFITDAWGDAPYTGAVNAAGGAPGDLFPVFDAQQDIYAGIIADLKSANTLLSKPVESYSQISNNADVLYGGSPSKWRKMANSLLLRYYMRISTKSPAIAKAGIEEIISNSATFPIFTANEDDATMGYIGSTASDSWPANTAQDQSHSNFDRMQLCAGFRDVLVDLKDPRIAVWFNKVNLRVKISNQFAPVGETITGGVRYLTPAYAATNKYVVYNKSTWSADVDAGKTLIDTMEYVGMPLAYLVTEPYIYNLNPNPVQGGPNASVSALSDIYKSANGSLLKARLISYAEVCFILAEAAQKGYSVGTQQSWYEKGVQASLNTWGVGGNYATYIANTGVKYDGSLKQIMVQKWIANWTVAFESWCDWRRTGLPALSFGTHGRRNAMPIRFKYDPSEININGVNAQVAIGKLVETAFTAQDGKDSSWSKMWLLQ